MKLHGTPLISKAVPLETEASPAPDLVSTPQLINTGVLSLVTSKSDGCR